MRAAIYSPYLDTFGGGEKYMMTIAEILSGDNRVDILLDQHLQELGADYLKDTLSKRFSLNLQKIAFINAPIGKQSSVVLRALFLKNYDVFVYLTDGSIFYPTAKKNILHIQSPLIGQPSKSAWGKFKLKGWDLIIYNSKFTEEHSKENWVLPSRVIYPPVDTFKIKPLKKKEYILSVGRFFGYLKNKKQEILIQIFKELFEAGKINGWSLHLVGSAGEGDKEYLRELQDLAKGIPIKFYPNLAYNDLVKLYGESSIYWHASGFEETDPTKMEHFGIATVEAMAGGCVPIVIQKGGQIEIIEDKISGYLWNTLNECKKLTVKVIRDEYLRSKLSENAVKRSKNFNKDKFIENILRVSHLTKQIKD
ncbi:hypothetical protein A3H40_04155 [Candidatus Daviesbacteria bacterium RIFCSPLOWO2_02_FULL_38_15]|uniref:Glycosyl transferase family 1 domain-containing protein n=1 Tax=Candidatus Daviesbacteria bacterium RIFCSPLOWO2_02_FULL_38_15 TaxID=1797794 RepID=A0A1F5N445_9BACT|nr:MAG: hypothetical protein A3H40_04155 [Candidatus Daviesbacteria bacterium RIFCSPLOWO2_02_FULL_38_15]